MAEVTPRVMVLDGDYDNAIQIATEVSADLDATVVGVGTSPKSRLLRSRYCDVGATVPTTGPGYPESVLGLVQEHRPDVVVPVGRRSVTATDEIRDRFPDGVACCLPPSKSLSTALDKRRTLALADRLGVDTPDEYGDVVAAATDRTADAVRDLPFPVFLKARHECNENRTAIVEEASSFWPAYERLAARTDVGDVLVQEYIADPRTFGFAALFVDGRLRLLFEHEERRSVPRRGGSGTRLRVYRHPALEAAALELLRALDWSGFALVEFKRTADGSFVLMEINPKLWASYALASQSGYRFVSTMVADVLDLDWSGPANPRQTGEMVFPLRELYYASRTDDESLLRAAGAMVWPPARWDLHLHDWRSWFTLPVAERDDADVGGPGGTSSTASPERLTAPSSAVDPRSEHEPED